MNDKQFFEEVMERSADKTYDLHPIKNISKLMRLLLIYQMTDENLKELTFYTNEKKIKTFLADYDPIAIRKIGSYTDLLYMGYEYFGEAKKALVKKLCHAASLAARYLSQYQTLADYKKELYLICVDEETTFDFLLNFRKISSLPSMYFLKTTAVFGESGLLDVPDLNKRVKAKMMEAFDLPDDNKAIYKRLIHIARDHQISAYELSKRIQHD